MVKVPEYQPNVQLRPAFNSDFSVRANADHFGAGVGRGMEALSQGVANVGDAIARVKALEDESISRDARNGFSSEADEAAYGEGGFLTTAGKGALDAFPGYVRRLDTIRKNYGSKLTPQQQEIFNKAVDADIAGRKRTALIHRGGELKKFTIQAHEAGAANHLTEAVRSYRDGEKSRKYLAAAHLETANLGELQGLAPDLIKLKQDAISDDYFSRVALDMVQSDPVSAVDFVQKNIQQMSPDAANKLLVDLAKPLGTAAGRDAVASGPTRVPADAQSRQQRAMSFYMSKGLTKEQASGIVGNLMAESQIKPSGAVGDQGTAFGVAQWRGAQTETVDNYRLRIETADNTLTIPEILADPVLDDGDRAALVSRYNEKFGDLVEAQRNVALFNAGQLRVDPYSAEGRKAVDGVWSQFLAAAGDQPERAVASLPGLVAQTGVVPERPFNLIRGAIAGSDFKQMIEGLDMATVLIDADKQAILRRDGGAAISDAVSAYKHWVGTMGLTPEAAAQRILEARDPEKVKARAALVESKPAKDWMDKQATSANIAKLFPEGGGWLSNAALGDNPVQEAAMTREYRDFLEDALHQAGGDYDAAAAIAGEAFKRLYGMTAFSLSGDEVISRLPVERTYRPDADGGYEYIRQQAKDLLKGEGIAASDVFLLADDLTERDVIAGKPARYRVFYADEAGALEEFNRPMSFTEPSPSEVAAAKRKASVERLRQNRADLERSRDREGNLDRFLDGDPLTGQLPQQGPPLSARPAKPAPGIEDVFEMLGLDPASAPEPTPWGAM